MKYRKEIPDNAEEDGAEHLSFIPTATGIPCGLCFLCVHGMRSLSFRSSQHVLRFAKKFQKKLDVSLIMCYLLNKNYY